MVEAACDRYGYHLLKCPSGGGYFIRHDTVCAEFGDLAGGSEGIPGVVVDWKSQVAAWPRSTRGYEADLGLFHIPGERDIYLDGVLSLANPRTIASHNPGMSGKGLLRSRSSKLYNYGSPIPSSFSFLLLFLKCKEK